MSKKALLCLATVVALAMGESAGRCEEWMPQREINTPHARVRGEVEYKEETRAGQEFVVLTVHVETKAQGRGQTARGSAIYTIFNADGSVYKTIVASKYASSQLDQPSKTADHETELRIRKDSFFEHLDCDSLVVVPEEKGGAPTNPKEALVWIKDVLGPEIDKARLKLMHEAAGAVSEGAGWIIKKRK